MTSSRYLALYLYDLSHTTSHTLSSSFSHTLPSLSSDSTKVSCIKDHIKHIIVIGSSRRPAIPSSYISPDHHLIPVYRQSTRTPSTIPYRISFKPSQTTQPQWPLHQTRPPHPTAHSRHPLPRQLHPTHHDPTTPLAQIHTRPSSPRHPQPPAAASPSPRSQVPSH